MDSVQNQLNEDDRFVQTKLLNWCRLCAKQDLSVGESTSIFIKNESGQFGAELATSIGKYFWVNIKADDEISQCLCLQCKQLLQELVAFTERVNKVQTLFCLLQNIKPISMEQAIQLRRQCGLIDEGWQHIIKQETPKPLLADQQVQTDDFISIGDDEAMQGVECQEVDSETEDIINILRNPPKNEECENQAEAEVEHVYEYVEQGENDGEFIEKSEFLEASNNETNEETIPISLEADDIEEEMDESEILKQITEEKEIGNYKIVSDDEELDFEDSSQNLELENDDEDEDGEHSIEVLDEEDFEEISGNENQSTIKTEVLPFLPLVKGKSGRPFGSKNTVDFNIRLVCKECKRFYKSPKLYRKHMKNLHDVDVDNLPEFNLNDNTCSICNKKLTTSSSLRLHMRYHLPDEEKFIISCPYCERKFSQLGAMRQHVNGIHYQLKPFICDQCGRACKTMAALNEHQLVHTNECPFECEVCHKGFKNKARLKTHMDTHTKSAYKCDDCGLELNTKRTLLQHRLVHSDEKRFKCEFCDAAFKRSKALKNHLILHSGLRPYKCNFCNKSFSNGSNCRAHKKRTHPRELAEEEANGKEPERVPIPKLEELKSAKGVLVQPRKVRRHASGLPNKLRQLLKSEKSKDKDEECKDYENSGETYDTESDYHYEMYKSENEDTISLVDHPNEECEETVIYEIIDEI